MALTARLLISFPVLCAALAAQSYVTFGGDGADKLFRQSRYAVGGDAAVTSVTSLVMTGTARVSAGDEGPPERAVEIRMRLPDQYVRIETAGDWSKRTGFSGQTLLTRITRGGTANTPPANIVPALLRAERARFARLLLGLASLATPEVWLTIRLAPGSSEAANPGNARVLEAINAQESFLARVFLNPSALPLRVDYDANTRKISTAFTDRRKVGELLLPHTITTTLDGMPLEELRFSAITVNAPLTRTDFEKSGSAPH